MEIIVRGAPTPKGRPRKAMDGHMYTPQETKDYEELVAILTRIATRSTLGGALKVRIDFYMPTPKSIKKKMDKTGELCRPTTKPDIDNLSKSVLDGMNSIAYFDDKQIVDLHCRKFYSDNPRTEIQVEEI